MTCKYRGLFRKNELTGFNELVGIHVQGHAEDPRCCAGVSACMSVLELGLRLHKSEHTQLSVFSDESIPEKEISICYTGKEPMSIKFFTLFFLDTMLNALDGICKEYSKYMKRQKDRILEEEDKSDENS